MREPALILIVHDHADNREILGARLASQGYARATAADGEAALAVARDLLPDLILLDVMMPKLDGFEACRRLRADPSLPYMPIILVRGFRMWFPAANRKDFARFEPRIEVVEP